MNKTALNIFVRFTLLSALISLLLFCVSAVSLAALSSDVRKQEHYPARILRAVSENMRVSGGGYALSDSSVIPEGDWCLLLDEAGDVVWSHDLPSDVPLHYSINDIARLTRWFLNDYPVYVRTEDYGLFILGRPRGSVGKYDLEFADIWFETLPQRALGVLLFLFSLSFVLALLIGLGFYKRLRALTQGISDLRAEKDVRLRERGIFKELSRNINETSSAISRKNAALLSRDTARANWVACISHDVRTPLSIIMGYSEVLVSSAPELSEDSRQKARIITAQSVRIKKLIEDLNLLSSLEYDMQPSRKRPLLLCPLIRAVVSDIINSGLDASYTIDLDLRFERARLMGDEALLERAFFNLINNSIRHNPSGCHITILEYTNNGNVCIELADNGSGVPQEVLDRIGVFPQSAHGLGLPMAYRIVHVHGGKMTAGNKDGFRVLIELPMI